MSIIALIHALLNAITEYTRLRQLSASYDLSRRIERDISEDEAELARLRTLGDSSSHTAADRLRNRIARAQGIAATLPTPHPQTQRGAGDPDP